MKSCLKYFTLLFSLYFTEGAFRCDYTYSSKTQTWFKLVSLPANFTDARLRCTLEGAVLASPTTPEILAEMRTIINRSYPEYEIFTGIHAIFSPGDFNTIEGTPLSKLPVPWAKNEPDNKDNNERCITLNGNGDLADRRCEETRPYICYHAESGQAEVSECGIDPEYYLDKRTNKCYKFHTVPRNFTRAFMACAAEGAHLAIINSDLEATVLKDLYGRNVGRMVQGDFQKDYAFIGFHDWGELWDFRTIHGQTLKEAGYNKFGPNDPNNQPPGGESCGSIDRNGVLNDFHCDRPVGFICEKSPGPLSGCQAPVDGPDN